MHRTSQWPPCPTVPTGPPARTGSPAARRERTGSNVYRTPWQASDTTGRPATLPVNAMRHAAGERTVWPGVAARSTPRWAGSQSAGAGAKRARTTTGVTGGSVAAGDGVRLSLRAAMERYERDLLESALTGRKSLRQVARELGLSHTALLAKVKKHRLA